MPHWQSKNYNMAACLVCSAQTEWWDFSKDGLRYRHCPACEYIRLDDTCRVSPAEEKKRYLCHENTLDNAGYVAMFEQFITAAVLPHTPSHAHILDFGCGPGSEPVLAVLLRRREFQVDIYDPHFHPGTAYRENTYACIVLTEVLEHLPDPLTTLTALRNNLVPRGVLALMTSFHTNDRDAFMRWWYRIDTTHISFFSSQTLTVLAGKLELAVSFVNNKNIVCLMKP